ncbi:MAG: LysM peptidoglycan-binding domain-containing protein [Caldilineaceae bacterium]|nr:LysM peptidoglycan-binding domain-containing protein [Caldilineaceae bacterium]
MLKRQPHLHRKNRMHQILAYMAGAVMAIVFAVLVTKLAPLLLTTSPAESATATVAATEGMSMRVGLAADANSVSQQTPYRPQKSTSSSSSSSGGSSSGCTSSSYTVQSGETVSDIARRYNTSSSRIRDCNNMANTYVQSGQQIQVPGTQQSGTATESRITRGYSSSNSPYAGSYQRGSSNTTASGQAISPNAPPVPARRPTPVPTR